MDPAFWQNQSAKLFVMYLVAYLAGLWVEKGGIRVNYTRKINHFILFFSPAILDQAIPFQTSQAAGVLAMAIGLASLGIYAAPIRARVRVIDTMFKSFDRPEDRPHTLWWLATQVAACYVIIVPLSLAFQEQGLTGIIVLTCGIGDGLAEPVGVRFGRHTYSTRGFFVDRTYTRSLEGSACVLLAGIGSVLLYQEHFTQPQFIAALLAFPVLMTLAEAFSPHTWDSPLMFLVGGLSLGAIVEFVK